MGEKKDALIFHSLKHLVKVVLGVYKSLTSPPHENNEELGFLHLEQFLHLRP
jgi:hypothetical protein